MFHLYVYIGNKYILKRKILFTIISMPHYFCIALLTTLLICIFFYLIKALEINRFIIMYIQFKKLKYYINKWYAGITKHDKLRTRINIQFSWISLMFQVVRIKITLIVSLECVCVCVFMSNSSISFLTYPEMPSIKIEHTLEIFHNM